MLAEYRRCPRGSVDARRVAKVPAGWRRCSRGADADGVEEMSAEYGIDYSLISFVDAANLGISEAPTADSDPLGFEAKEAIKAVRGGDHGRAKFRYNRKERAWSGQTSLIPEIVLENAV